MTRVNQLLSAQLMLKAFKKLDGYLSASVTLIMGGGGAMILAHEYPLATTDVDAIAKGIEVDDLEVLVKKIGREINLPPDWLNPYFSSFSYVIPSDFAARVKLVFKGKFLHVEALGREEMFLMKCFAHRNKDRPHAKALLKLGIDMKIVEDQFAALEAKRIPGVASALAFFDEMLEEVE